MKSLKFLLFLTLFESVFCATPAGIYVDNGFDQTAIERYLTKQEKREMELEILNLLGLPNRPRKGLGKLKKSAPGKFLMDVYMSLMEKENGREERSAMSFSGEEQNAIDESDIIMTFDSIGHHVSSVRHERGKRLWFNVSDVPVGESIVGAELRIYQRSNYTAEKNPEEIYTVTAYELIRTENGERELEYITAVNTTAGYSGWLELNLTSCLATWVAIPDANKGLYLSVHPAGKPAHELRPEDIGLVTMKGEDETKPFMVAFLKANNHVNVRMTRDTRRVRKSDYHSVMRDMGGHDTLSTQSDSKSCRIHSLYISFKDLKWHDWIIAPEGYQAYFCRGECNFPLNNNMNATNHAIVQTLVHLMSPVKFPKPCCAPTKLNPISVLYHLTESNVTLKKYKRMVVKSCGCL